MSEKKSIIDKMQKLEDKIDWFYSEDFTLDKATEKYKEARELADEIEKDLDNLKNEFSIVQKDFTKEL